MSETEKMSVGEAAGNYLSSLSSEEQKVAQPDVSKFVRWFGADKSLAGLAAHEIENYADRISTTDKDYSKKLETVKVFLTYARDQTWSKTNLSLHLKPKKGKKNSGPKTQPEVVPVTQEGYVKLKAEVEELKLQRPRLIEEITKAAADKDFRENAPLEAAREQHGFVEGRIREIEALIKAAEIVGKEQQLSHKVHLGDTIILVHIESGEEMCYQIVGPRETNPSKGKISGVSPVGKAVVGCIEGQTIEVIVPVGKIKYQIKQIVR